MAFLYALGTSIIIPIQPTVMMEILATQSLSKSVFVLGMLSAVQGTISFLVAPVLGALSDRIGRRPILFLAALGQVIGSVSLALIDSVPILFIVYSISGATAVLMNTLMAYCADMGDWEASTFLSEPSSREGKRTSHFGAIMAAVVISFVFGPATGGILGDIIGARNVCLLAAIPASLACIFVVVFMREPGRPSLKCTRSQSHEEDRLLIQETGSEQQTSKPAPLWWQTANPFRPFRLVFFRGSNVIVLFVVFVFVMAADESVRNIFIAALQKRFRWPMSHGGVAMGIFGLSSFAAQGIVLPFSLKYIPSKRLLSITMSVAIVSLLVMGRSPWAWLFVIACVCYGVGGLSITLLKSALSQTAPGEEQGELMGALGAGDTVVASLASVASGAAFKLPNPPDHSLVIAYSALLYFLGGLVALAAWLVQRRRAMHV